MLYVEETTIKLTRGDTAYLRIPMETTEGAYEMQPTDTLTFSVKRNTRDEDYIFQKKVIGDNVFHVQPADTSEFAFGKYVYDVQLDTVSGDVFTVVPPSTFEILAEVTH